MSEERTVFGNGSVESATRLPATLPSADTVGAYERAVPGAAERILAMAERAVEHTIRVADDEREYRRIEARQRHARGMLGLVFGFIVVVLAVFFGGSIAYLSESVMGVVIAVGVPVVLVAGWALAGRSLKNDL